MARGTKVPRQGAFHSVADDEMVMAPKAKSYRESRLESLPAEIRRRIYLFVGIFDGAKGWAKCHNWPDCTDPSHYKKALSSNDRGTTDHRDHYQNSFLQCQITRYWFGEYDGSMPRVEGLCYRRQAGHTYPCDVHHLDYETYEGHLGLLCTNKFLCADVYSLIYNNIPTEFRFELSNRAIHLNNWPKQHPDTPSGSPGDYYKKHTWEHMKLSPFPFRFMTTIILSYEIGMGYESQMPHRYLAYSRRVGSFLTKQATSIRYIARHCPALRELEIRPLMTRIEKCKLGVFDVMAFAMQELVCGCPDLQRIALTYVETKKVSLADYPEILDVEQHDFGNFFHDLLFGNDSWFNIFKAQDCLDVRNIPQELREDEIREWVKGVLVKIRKHNLQAPDPVQQRDNDGHVYKTWAEKFSTIDSWYSDDRIDGPGKATYYRYSELNIDSVWTW
ncbi:uncharacterized protein BDZ99DRAFT_568443 [Mytilinidion resinicola]|uniref:Uncharacterized protein n=1 Tax=Mytilinidion resinicola TaxID=574789 RepID=A0A6A6YZ49_9PEZI|nr:uncharacterized protein BDZ99DRAFT_568443 [Mytilinidion resinicola]KAF2813205.1 hypothetical protein BDZ99DRAFT_568443 [Mytilinidion resinicola]